MRNRQVQRGSTLEALIRTQDHQDPDDEATAGLSKAQKQRLRKKMRDGKA